jgi:RNA polymerase sigma-70 factor (ECF subfamily)
MNNKTEDISREFMTDRCRLMAFIRSMLRDYHVAEDVFQEVWVQLSRAIETGVEIQDTAKWSRGTARNLILHRWREEKKSRIVINSALLERLELAFEEQDTDQEVWHQREMALKRCLDELPDKSRKILSLKYDLALTVEVVAGRLGKSVGATMMFLSRLKTILKDCVAAKMSSGEVSA